MVSQATNVQALRLDARTIIMQPTNQFFVTWGSQPGEQYSFKATASVSSNGWSVLPGGTISASNVISTHSIAVANNTRFFMLMEDDTAAPEIFFYLSH